jgi:hypothetical protein
MVSANTVTLYNVKASQAAWAYVTPSCLAFLIACLYAAAFHSSALLFAMKNLFICCGVCLEHSTITLECALKEDFFLVGWFGFELLLLLAVTDERSCTLAITICCQ